MTPIRTARLMRGLSQTDLAARMGISPQSLSQYESGARSLGPKLLPVAAQVLDVSPAYLAGLAQSIPVFDCVAGRMEECAIMRQESIPGYGMLYLVDTTKYGAKNVILADGAQYVLHTQLYDQGITIDQINSTDTGRWVDSRGHIALMVDGLPRAIETVRFNTVYRILSEKTVVGRMKAHPDELWDGEDTAEVDRVRLRLWIESDPIISVEAEGEIEGDDCIILDDGTCMLLKQELIKKAEAAGIDGEFWRGISILTGVTSSFGYMRSAAGEKAGWETLYLALCVTLNGFANARAYKTLEEARREAGKLNIRKARCKFDDKGICTVVEWEEADEE